MEDVLEHAYFGNTPRQWLIAAVVAAIVFAGLWAIEWLVRRRFSKLAERSRFAFDDVVVGTLRATRFWFTLAVALWAASLALSLDDVTRQRVGTGIKLALIVQAALWANAAIGSWVRSYSAQRAATDPSAVTTMRAVGLVGRLVAWALLVIAALGALGIEIAPLLAGLGIGGVAVALAVQNVLGDLFASLSIVLDKPFVIGDFIVVGSESGTVEQIGLKTTRVRSISGEQLVFSNSDLLSSRIRNYKRMNERRVVFSLGVTYQTPRDKLIAIPAKIREIIEAQPDTRFDRAHFVRFGPSSLDYEIVYYAKTPDYSVYVDRQQAINLAIHEYFEAQGIEFAYPTSVVYLATSGDAPPAAEVSPGAA